MNSSSATSSEPRFSLALIATLIIISTEDIMPVNWPVLEALGEEAVRALLARGQYGRVDSVMYKEVKEWLDHKQVEREKHDAEARRKRDDRAEIREESKAKWGKIVAWVTIAGVIITLLSLFRWNETEKVATTAFEQTRAWMSLHRTAIKGCDEGIPDPVDMEVQNSGNSPAFQVYVRSKPVVAKAGTGRDWPKDWPLECQNLTNPSLTGRHTSLVRARDGVYSVGEDYLKPLSPEERKDVREDKTMTVYYLGCVYYYLVPTTVPGEPTIHHTHFCSEWMRDTGCSETPRDHTPKKHFEYCKNQGPDPT